MVAASPVPRARTDAGATLAEVLVSLSVISITMAALTPFLVTSFLTSAYQSNRQTAVRLANDALEQARTQRGKGLLSGRGQLKSTQQWNAAGSAVQPYLAAMTLTWDSLLTDPASTAGDTAALPTATQTVSVGGLSFLRDVYVGTCRQQAVATSVTCVRDTAADPNPDATDLPMFRVVVAVTWRQSSCPGNTCTYVTTALVSNDVDPIFNINRPPPVVTNPGNLTAYRTEAVSKQIFASGGQLPVTWTASGLPSGLSMSAAGLVTGTPTTLQTVTVTVTATDRVGLTDNDTFTWTVAPPLVVTNPGNQTGRTGTALSLAAAATGGVSPLTWSASNLPAGLTVNASNGTISGTPTTGQSSSVTLTATDSKNKAVSVTFTWQVLTPVVLSDPGTQTVTMTLPFTMTAAGVSGGAAPYTWRATTLPPGLSINAATGVVSGNATQGTRHLATLYVADSAGMEVGRSVAFRVTPLLPTDLQVTAPSPVSPDRTGNAGQAASLTAAASGGAGGYTWTATGLPAGVSIAAAGSGGATVSGTPTTPGVYTVRLTVRDLLNTTAVLAFTWTVL